MAAGTGTVPEARIEAVRGFNRFYTQKIGVLREGLLESPFSLTEARILYELAHREAPTASALGKALGLDAGYLSRILQGFEKQGLIRKTRSADDGRQWHIRLTATGRKAFAALDSRSRAQVAALLGGLSEPQQRQAVEAMGRIEALLGDAWPANGKGPFLLRQHRPGDMGWVVYRHGILYAQEYGWDERFEALVAEIAAKFIQHYDPKREHCWIAEKEGEIAGCAFLVRHSATVAKLRLLLVEPGARGLGLGRRLVEECIRFARSAGYRKIMLWTNDVLHAARHIYEKAGFRLVHRERHKSFGHDLVGETWALKL